MLVNNDVSDLQSHIFSVKMLVNIFFIRIANSIPYDSI